MPIFRHFYYFEKNFLFKINKVFIVTNCKYTIGINNIKYIIPNLKITSEATKPKCKKKNENTTNATQGHIRA